MDQKIGLLVNGVSEWYENLASTLGEHGKTWLQNSDELKSSFALEFNEQIRSKGFFFAFGYVQAPYSKIMHRFKVEQIVSGPQRIGPPDETAPPYSSYDHSQGGCRDGSDFRYRAWLRVIEHRRIEPVDQGQFINLSTGNPVPRSPRQAHFYVEIPEFLREDLIEESRLLPQEEALGITVGLERDLETFIIENLEHIERGLRLYPRGQQYNLSIGRVDILCTDANDNFVVLELKAGTVASGVVSQILSYMGAVKQELGENKDVRGIIIGGEFDARVKSAVYILPQLRLMKYRVHFEFEDVG